MSIDDKDAKAGDTAQGSGEPQYATLDQITDATSEMINKALTARNKQLEAKVEKTLAELTKKFEERVSQIQTAPGNKDSGEPKVEDTPVYKGLQKQLTEMQQKLELAEREKSAERSRARDRDLRARLSDELVKAGVDPSRVRHAVGLLVDSDKRVRNVDDTDEAVFLDTDGQEVDFRTGLKSWLKSEDAKIYMPARGTTGTGERRPAERKPANGANNVDSQEELMMDLLKFARGGNI